MLTFIILLILSLQISVIVHIFHLSKYLSTKSKKNIYGFLITTITNMFIAITLATTVMFFPDSVNELKLDLILIIESGLFFSLIILNKIIMTARILKRTKDPENYHLSYLGKKIYVADIVTKKELAIYFLSIPFMLFAGSYFYFMLAKYNN